jgi:hypothetical protein
MVGQRKFEETITDMIVRQMKSVAVVVTYQAQNL